MQIAQDLEDVVVVFAAHRDPFWCLPHNVMLPDGIQRGVEVRPIRRLAKKNVTPAEYVTPTRKDVLSLQQSCFNAAVGAEARI